MIIVAGKNNIAVYVVKTLLNYYHSNKIGIILSKYDNGKDDWQLSLKKFALKKRINTYNIKNIYNKAEIFISCEYENIIDINNFETTNLFNFHFSLLPKYRGVYTSIWPLYYQDKNSGVTIHKISRKIDAGKIILQKQYKIKSYYCSLDIYLNNIFYSKKLFDKFLPSILRKKFEYTKSAPKILPYKSKLSFNFKNNKIDFYDKAENISRRIKIFSFRPYQLIKFNNKSIVNSKIILNKSIFKPGHLVKRTSNYFIVTTIDYDIKIFIDKFNNVKKSVKNDNLDMLKKYINNIININDRDHNMRSLIMIGAIYSSFKCIDYLKYKKADLYLEDKYDNDFDYYLKKSLNHN